ncbi:MAG TPA: cation transporter [Alphaproteobacteria bacterium]
MDNHDHSHGHQGHDHAHDHTGCDAKKSFFGLFGGGGGHEHTHNFDGATGDYRLRLWIVIAINAIMFVAEMTAGAIAGSQALKADALDFLADTLTYGISLAVIGMPLYTRATAALAKGASLAVMGVWVFTSTIYNIFILNVPAAPIMAGVAIAALIANAICVFLLASYAKGDSNVRSVWLCSRNDMFGNAFVVMAAAGVWGTDTAWPDLIVAGVMAFLFLQSSVRIIRQAVAERNGVLPS